MVVADPERSRLGRYELFHEIGVGGMATVHLGRAAGSTPSAPTLAIKRLHAQFARDPAFSLMFLDEARLAASIRHPNVVATHEVVATEGELLLVMEYVPGLALSRVSRLARAGGRAIPVSIVLSIVRGVLEGLHAAHEAHSPDGLSLGIVHRDVSPQNVIVGTDGVARVLDFGVAKAVGRLHTTRQGEIKGKLPYMPPEQLDGTVSRQTDIYASAVLLWELLTGEHPFRASSDGETIKRVLFDRVEPPGKRRADLPRQLDWTTLRGLERDPAQRYKTAREMATALEECGPIAAPTEVAAWLEEIAAEPLREERARSSEIAAMSASDRAPPEATVTAVSRTLDDPALAAAAKRLRLAVVAVVAALTLLATALVAARVRRPPSPEVAPPPMAVSLLPSSSVAPGSSAIASPEPTASESASSPLAGGSPRRAPSRPPPARSAPKPKSNCAPPYVTDAVGHKHFKEECL